MRVLPVLAWMLLAAAIQGCSPPSETSGESAPAAAAASGPAAGALPPGDWFVERAHASGIDFVHVNGMSGRFYQPEIMAPGVALFDYDNDGDLDVFLVQGEMLGSGRPLIAPPSGAAGSRLYRNDLTVRQDGSRTLHFTDVTEEARIHTRGYGMGVAAGDVDNDGRIDLYLTAFTGSQMLHNNGDGTFSDITQASGTGNDGSWGVSATFFDYDRDGLLDLFVGNYLSYTLQTHVACFGPSGAPDYCRPEVYRAQPNRLFHNEGHGRFTDVTIAAGVAREFGPALGASTADFNGDGWLDLFVANDEQENQLWINQRDGTFVNTALTAGAALGASGERKANMGVDAGDFDADGDEDLFVTELVAQGSSLWVNDGSATFEEQSARRGIRAASLAYTGFGTAWIDFDNDGWLDLLAVNGDVNQNVKTPGTHDNPFPLAQRRQLFRNWQGRFTDVSTQAGTTFQAAEVGRGAAFGDIDNDGDSDVLVGNGAGPTRLLINEVGSRNHWLGLRLIGTEGRRDMLGARIEVRRQSTSALWRRVRADGSYASANDPRVLVGLGSSREKPDVRVLWPDGTSETWRSVEIDRYVTLEQGSAP